MIENSLPLVIVFLSCFTQEKLANAPDAAWEAVTIAGVAPENYHSTSMLHTIATGNMTPSYRVLSDGTVRPVFLYTVDADEFEKETIP